MKRVLICALDWGLGHATRCIPIIRTLEKFGHEVTLASSGDAGILLKLEFPQLDYVELPAYNPHYSRAGSPIGSLVMQMPKFLRTIKKENDLVGSLVVERSVDVVISDNRYGCHSTRAKSIFLTHQLRLHVKGVWSIFNPWINSELVTATRWFNEVWVPDSPATSLCGQLLTGRVPFTYVGWLSRFSYHGEREKRYDVMAVVSGPEPQRSSFEHVVLEQLKRSGRSALVVTGQPGTRREEKSGLIEIVNHLSAVEMQHAVSQSDVILSRSGYSTIMDLITLKKKAVFVPTPGQPEQEYFGKVLHEHGVAYCMDQKNFVLDTAMKEATSFKGLGVLSNEDGLLEEQIENL